jgi:hypothetical protein
MNASIAMPRWLRIAPLGLPVVPDVYMRHQASSGDTGTPGSAAGAPAIKSS